MTHVANVRIKKVPLVSVLMPVRNGVEHLRAALDSLAAQTLDDMEVIVVDDGSTDGTAALLDSRAGQDPALRVVRQKPSGIVPALEHGRSVARGRYLARMDADDRADPERLEKQLLLLENEPDLVGCGTLVEYFPRQDLGDGTLRYESWINSLVDPDEIERDFFVECPLAHPTFFLRSAAVAAVGGYRDRGWPEDYDLLLRLREKGARLAKVPEVLLRWREGAERLSRVDPAYSLEAFRRCKVHFLRRTHLRGRDGAVVWGAGNVGKAFGLELLRQDVRLRGWVEVNARKIGQEIHGAPVLAVEDAGSVSDALHLGAVGQPGARADLRRSARDLGLIEGRNFVAVA